MASTPTVQNYDKKRTQQAGGMGAAQGALAGAATGASIGTAVTPGIGTAIGAGIGALIGAGVGGGTAAWGEDIAQKQEIETSNLAASAAKQAEIDQKAAARASMARPGDKYLNPPTSSAAGIMSYMPSGGGTGVTPYDRYKGM